MLYAGLACLIAGVVLVVLFVGTLHTLGVLLVIIGVVLILVAVFTILAASRSADGRRGRWP